MFPPYGTDINLFKNISGVAGPLAAWCGGQIAALLSQVLDKNSSGDEIANVNFYAVRPEATRFR